MSSQPIHASVVEEPLALDGRSRLLVRRQLTATAVIGYESADSLTSPDPAALASAERAFRRPLRDLFTVGRQLEQLGVHSTVVADDGSLALALVVPGGAQTVLRKLTRAIAATHLLQVRPHAAPPPHRNPLRAAQALAHAILNDQIPGSDGGTSKRAPSSEVLRPRGATVVGPTGLFVSGTRVRVPSPDSYRRRPFVGVITMPGAHQVHVLKVGPGPESYGSPSWVRARALEQQLLRGPESLSALLRRGGLSYGASIRLTTRRPPHLTSLTYAAPASALARTLQLAHEALRGADVMAATVGAEQFARIVEEEREFVLTDSERAATIFAASDEVVPAIFRSDFEHFESWATPRVPPLQQAGDMPVTILIGDEIAIRRSAPDLHLDHVWSVEEAGRL